MKVIFIALIVIVSLVVSSKVNKKNKTKNNVILTEIDANKPKDFENKPVEIQGLNKKTKKLEVFKLTNISELIFKNLEKIETLSLNKSSIEKINFSSLTALKHLKLNWVEKLTSLNFPSNSQLNSLLLGFTDFNSDLDLRNLKKLNEIVFLLNDFNTIFNKKFIFGDLNFLSIFYLSIQINDERNFEIEANNKITIINLYAHNDFIIQNQDKINLDKIQKLGITLYLYQTNNQPVNFDIFTPGNSLSSLLLSGINWQNNKFDLTKFTNLSDLDLEIEVTNEFSVILNLPKDYNQEINIYYLYNKHNKVITYVFHSDALLFPKLNLLSKAKKYNEFDSERLSNFALYPKVNLEEIKFNIEIHSNNSHFIKKANQLINKLKKDPNATLDMNEPFFKRFSEVRKYIKTFEIVYENFSDEGIDDNIKNTLLNDKCSICLDEFKNGDKISITPCNHSFHKGCLANAQNHNCPLCRQKLANINDYILFRKNENFRFKKTFKNKLSLNTNENK